MAHLMGIGLLGDKNIVFKRKFRWTFQVQDICGSSSIPESFVKLAARPNLSIEETEINFLNAKTWIPGKGSWNTISVTYIDVANVQGTSLNASQGSPDNLYKWLASVYDFRGQGAGATPGQLNNGSRRRDYAATGVLNLYDGCGGTLETWYLNDMWPTEVNFGELDYAASEEVTIELTLRYSAVEFLPGCGATFPPPCCTSC
jgi:hypothetical protein